MRKLAVYLKPYWKSAVLAPLLMLLEVVTDLLQPTLMADIVDKGMANGDIGFITRTGIIMIATALLGVVGGGGCIIFSSVAAQSFGTDLRMDLFKKVQSFSFANLDKFRTASLVTRLTNDIVQVQNVVLTMLRILVRAPLLSIGGFVMALIGDANDRLMDITIKAMRVVGINMPIMILVMNFTITAVIWFGGIKVNSGNMQVGEIIAFVNYMTQILFSLMMVAFMLMMVSRAKASSDRILEVMGTETEIKDEDGASDKRVELGRVDFENVYFQYKGAGGEPVLRNITFTAMPGETIAILGATGSGKSTMVNLIPRFYDVTKGRVLVDGRDVRSIKLDTLRKNAGMVLQEAVLFSGTIMENIKWGSYDASDEEAMEAAKAAQAHDFIIGLPEGYNTVLGQRGVNLSGGQKQRLSIARALLKKLMKDSTCFVIVQRISSVLEADKIIVLEDGRIIDMGTHSQLMEYCAVYQDIYHSQLGKEEV